MPSVFSGPLCRTHCPAPPPSASRSPTSPRPGFGGTLASRSTTGRSRPPRPPHQTSGRYRGSREQAPPSGRDGPPRPAHRRRVGGAGAADPREPAGRAAPEVVPPSGPRRCRVHRASGRDVAGRADGPAALGHRLLALSGVAGGRYEASTPGRRTLVDMPRTAGGLAHGHADADQRVFSEAHRSALRIDRAPARSLLDG